jgi:EF-hand domain pair
LSLDAGPDGAIGTAQKNIKIIAFEMPSLRRVSTRVQATYSFGLRGCGLQRQEKDLSYRNSICGIGVTVALLVMGEPLALAQSPGAMSGPEVWDANHDGVYTCEEWKNYLDRIFTLADRNRDGNLDQSEFATARKASAAVLPEAEFGYFDENQDGKINRKEFVGKQSEFILRYDRNGDCRVTSDEVRAANAPKGPQGPPVRPRDVFH